MRERLISFFSSYVFVPVIFYIIDMACQSTFVTGSDISFLILNFVLIACTTVVFVFLLTQNYIPIRSPIAAAAGGIVGLLHFFQYYMIVGTFWVWHTARFTGFSATEKKLLWLNFINPFFNLQDMICDGSGPAILAVGVLFIIMAVRLTRRRK